MEGRGAAGLRRRDGGRLLDLAHGKDLAPFDRSIDTRIAGLWAKVEVDASKPQAIKAVCGAGCAFAP